MAGYPGIPGRIKSVWVAGYYRYGWPDHPGMRTNAPDVAGRDWVFCRFYEGAVNTGYIEDKYALCLITGAKRPITISEHYEIFGATD